MVANLVLPRRVSVTWRSINTMILMPQIYDVAANENARYKYNELEYGIHKYKYKNWIKNEARLPWHKQQSTKLNIHGTVNNRAES